MKKPLISVIIPVYNTAQYLAKCLDSVVNQTIGNSCLEIIVMNDGSPDNSAAILEDYKERYSNIILLSQENMGLGAARNNAIPHATGDYLAFVDSDDYIPLDAYEKLYAASGGGAVDIVAGRLECLYRDGNIFVTFFELFENNNESVISADVKADKRCWALIRHSSVCCRIFRTKLIVENNIKNAEGLHYEDIQFTFIASLLAKNINVINEITYNYIRRDDSIMGQSDKRSYLDIFTVFDETYRLINGHGLERYKYIFDHAVLDCHLPHMDRWRNFLNKSCITTYNLSEKEYSDITSIIKNIVRGTNLETVLLLEKKNRKLFLQTLSKLAEHKETVDLLKRGMYIKHPGLMKKAGRYITWLPRKIRALLRCLRLHGFGYTAKLIVAKFST